MRKFLLAIIPLLLASCSTTKYVPVIEYRTDTIWQKQIVTDSVIIRDSTIIERRGDTVFFDRWHTRWRDRVRIDTVYQSKVDSIPVPYEVEKCIKADLTWWQRTRMHLGEVFLGAISAALIGLIIYIGLWARKFIP